MKQMLKLNDYGVYTLLIRQLQVFVTLSFLMCTAVWSASPTWNSNDLPDEITMCWHEVMPYSSPQLDDGGLLEDFVSTVMHEAGFKTKMLYVPWARCREGVKAKEYDMLFAMWNGVDQHIKFFDFLEPTIIDVVGFIVLDDSPLTSGNLSDLQDVRLGLTRYGGYDRKIIEHDGFNLMYVNKDIQKVKMLLHGRIDMAITDERRLNYILRTELKDYSTRLRLLEPAVREEKNSTAILKSNPHKEEIIERYAAAYKRLCENGVLEALIKKHGFYYSPIGCRNH